MWSSTILVAFLLPIASSFLYMNHSKVVSNPAISNVSIDYNHDAKGQCVLNVTFVTFKPLTRMTIYIKIQSPEDRFDKKYKNVLISSVFEAEKVFKGMQSNIFIRGFFSAVRKSMTFEYRLPLPPVSCLSCWKPTNRDNFIFNVFLHREFIDSLISSLTRHSFLCFLT